MRRVDAMNRRKQSFWRLLERWKVRGDLESVRDALSLVSPWRQQGADFEGGEHSQRSSPDFRQITGVI